MTGTLTAVTGIATGLFDKWARIHEPPLSKEAACLLVLNVQVRELVSTIYASGQGGDTIDRYVEGQVRPDNGHLKSDRLTNGLDLKKLVVLFSKGSPYTNTHTHTRTHPPTHARACTHSHTHTHTHTHCDNGVINCNKGVNGMATAIP